jgi:imidazolonepropionase
MPSVDLLIRGVDIATMQGRDGFGLLRDGAIAIRGDTIAWVGADRDVPRDWTVARTLALPGHLVTPGLVDCHTHLVYAGNRAHEFERRLAGATYADIAREGGGIRGTVRATREASEDALVEASRPRLAALVAEGVTTVEIKSGYGLDTATEQKQLRAARRLAAEADVDVRTTLLAAHALAPEFSDADAFIDYACREMIPARAVDAFCETVGFTPAQTDRVLAAARAQGLAVKLHADQLSDLGGAALAARHGALSADHLEYTSADGVRALAQAGTVAVLLPGAFYALRETQAPPVAALRAAGVPIALATDCNPGTSPTTSPTLMMNMACTLFGLTTAEALRGVTQAGAKALGLVDRGVIDVGLRADLALWQVSEPAELAYRVGSTPCAGLVREGRLIRGRDAAR